MRMVLHVSRTGRALRPRTLDTSSQVRLQAMAMLDQAFEPRVERSSCHADRTSVDPPIPDEIAAARKSAVPCQELPWHGCRTSGSW
jgi:hypothetical protein